jgi:hypothetical protein
MRLCLACVSFIAIAACASDPKGSPDGGGGGEGGLGTGGAIGTG